MNEPKLLDVSCIFCGHEWTAFCPNGLEEDGYVECPKCGKNGGQSVG